MIITYLKSKLFTILLSLSVFFAPVYATIAAITFIIFVDTFTGIYAAYKSGEKITSRKMSNMITKILLYDLVILVSFVIDTVINPYINLVKVVSFFISTVELKSIFENVNKATGLDLWSEIKQYLNRKKVD